MESERILELRGLFETAIELDPIARDAWLADWRERDPELGTALQRLLEQDRDLAGLQTQRAFDVERLTDAVHPRAGATIGGYTLEEEIGRGGMGLVFRATRANDPTPVAIKLLRRDRVNPALLRRFSTERAILASLDHCGIARLLDAGTTDDGTPFVVMELVRGSAILDWCDRRSLGLWRRLELFRKVLAAVAHAHGNLVVHRDIKSSNVLVGDNGEPRLLDFGIAKPLGRLGDVDRTATAERFVSLFTAAPEQLDGGPVTTGCDIYALGMLLYELLSGRAPYEFDAMTSGEIDRAIRLVPPPPMTSRIADADALLARSRGLVKPRELRAGLRGDLEHIVQRCLRKRTEERYASVDQLDHDIDHAMLGLPIRERQSDGWYRWRRFLGRHRVSAALFAAIAVAVVAAAALGVRAGVRLVEERDRAGRAADVFAHAFAVANPLERPDSGVTARDVLDAARMPLEALHDTQPGAYVEVATRLAQAELAHGAYARASELAQRAITTGARAGLDAGSLAPLLTLDARARIGLGDYASADVLLHWAERQGGASTPAWKLAKGRLLFRQERCVDAIGVLSSALGDDGAAAGDDVAIALQRELADALRAARRQNDAVAVLDRLAAAIEAQFGANHPQLVLVRRQRLDTLSGAVPSLVPVHAAAVGVAARGVGSAVAEATPASFASADPPPPMRCNDGRAEP